MTESHPPHHEVLRQQRCIPCRSGSPMPLQEAKALLCSLTGWHIMDGGMWLQKHLTFRNFAEALVYVNAVAAIAEAEEHHPDLTFGWGYVTIRLQTHAIGGLHRNDFILAAKLDAL